MEQNFLEELPDALIKNRKKKIEESCNQVTVALSIIRLFEDIYSGQVYITKSSKDFIEANKPNSVWTLELVVHFPEINIQSSGGGRKRLLRDFFAKLEFTIEKKGDFRFSGFKGARGSLTQVEVTKGYIHSHISSGGFFMFGGFCMGQSDIGKIYNTSNLSFDHVYALAFNLKAFLEHESIEGTPYKRISDIFNSRNVTQSISDTITREGHLIPPERELLLPRIVAGRTSNDVLLFSLCDPKDVPLMLSYAKRKEWVKKFQEGVFTKYDLEKFIDVLTRATTYSFFNKVTVPVLSLPKVGYEQNVGNSKFRVQIASPKSKKGSAKFVEGGSKLTLFKFEPEEEDYKLTEIVFKSKTYSNFEDLESSSPLKFTSEEDFLAHIKQKSVILSPLEDRDGTGYLWFNSRLAIPGLSLAESPDILGRIVYSTLTAIEEDKIKHFLTSSYEQL